jgi:hypothetical protein
VKEFKNDINTPVVVENRQKQQAKEKLAEIKKASNKTFFWDKRDKQITPQELFDLMEQAGFELPL